MARGQPAWQTITLHPLNAPLDTRSRPADLTPGAYRQVINHKVSITGQLSRRPGHQKFYSDRLYDSNGVLLTDPASIGDGPFYHNFDLHHQGATREPPTLQFVSVASDGTRRFFVGTQSRLYLLNEATGDFPAIATGKGASQSRFHAAELQDRIFFTNDVNEVLCWDIATSAMIPIPELTGVVHITKAKVVIQFEGILFLMNLWQDGVRQSSRIQWSNLNDGTAWDPGTADTLAGFQDLDYGDDIQAACVLSGSVYIFTKRSIWRMSISTSATDSFSFTRIYTEPKNETGCIAYANALVCTGTEVFFAGRDTIYRYNPYLPEPVRDDWLYKALGDAYATTNTKLDVNFGQSPILEYSPVNEELWFSWPSAGQNGINNLTLVMQIKQRTAGLVDTGYTSFCNFQRTPASGQTNEVQEFLGASGRDFCIKEIGEVFFRQYVTLVGPVTADILEAGAVYYNEGYNSLLRGLMPLGLTDREKIVSLVNLSQTSTETDAPCAVRLRIGNSFTPVDPNSAAATCSPLWRQLPNQSLSCPKSRFKTGATTNNAMRAANIRTSDATDWACYDRGIFLYYEFTITNADNSLAIGGETFWEKIDFRVMATNYP